jgi:hypothetical protein
MLRTLVSSAGKNKLMNAEKSPFKDDYWVSRGSSKLLTYIGPELCKNLERPQVKEFMRKRGVWGAMWNYDHDYTDEGPWYRCICDNAHYDESAIKSKNAKHNLRRGLKRCVTRRVDYTWLGDKGYDVYVKAAARYKNFKVESLKEFIERMYNYSGQSGAEALGVFVGDKLVAYVTLFICGQSVRGDTAHFDPSYANCYPMYALYYTIAHHYLRERGCKEVDRGSKPLVHETNVDDFLLRLGYRKAYCRLGIYFIWRVRIVLKVAKSCRRLYKLILPRRFAAMLEGLLQAQDIAKTSSE